MCDRTNDFVLLSKQLISQNNLPNSSSLTTNSPLSSSAFNKNNQTEQQSSFLLVIHEVSSGVYSSNVSLSRLTSLVKQQGLFNDSTNEINRLILTLKQSIHSLNTQCDEILANIPKYIEEMHLNSSSSSSSSSSTSSSLTSLLGLTSSSSSSSHSSQHMQAIVLDIKGRIGVIANGFKSALELRSEKLKEQELRKENLTGTSRFKIENSSASTSTTSSLSSTSSRPSFLNSSSSNTKKPEPIKTWTNPYQFNDPDPDKEPLLASNDQQTQSLLLSPVSYTDATNMYHESRSEAAKQVEDTLSELSTMFSRLGLLLTANNDMIQRIDEDLEAALDNTDKATKDLLKAYETASSNRGLMMKIGVILILFILFFIVFLL